MLMSAAIELKFHSWPKKRDDIVYKPPNLSRCTSASWSKDNSYLTYLSEKSKPEILLLKDNTIKLIHTITAISDVSALCFQRTTKRCIAVGTYNGQVVMYDTKTKTINKLFGNVPATIKFLDFNFGDEHLGVACTNGNAVIYDVADGHVCGNYVISDSSEPTALRFHPQSPHILAASSEEGTVMLWDTTTANKTFFAQTHAAPICGLAFGKLSNDIVVTVGEDNKFCIHDLSIRECVFRSIVQHPLSAVDVSPEGGTIAIGSQDGTMYLYDVRNFLQPVRIWKPHSSKVTKIAYTNLMKDMPSFVDTSVAEFASNNAFQDDASKISTRMLIDIEAPSSSKLSYASKKSFDRHDVENDYLKKMKGEVIASIQKDAQDVNNQLKIHMNNLQTFIQNEFQKMDAQMDDKWELLNLASLNLTKDPEDILYPQSMSSSRVEENLV